MFDLGLAAIFLTLVLSPCLITLYRRDEEIS